MVFPKNNLPTQSQPWTRDVEKRVENLESTFKSAEVNNVTRDSQALSQIRRLDGAVTEAALAAANAQAAIDGLGNLDQSTSTFKINAANITVGSLSGDRISGGTISGVNFETVSGTESLTLSSGKINFFENGTGIGSMAADTDGSNDYIQISSSSGIGQLTIGSDYSVLAGSNCAVQPGIISDGRIDLTGTLVSCNANLTVNGTLSATTFSPTSLSTGSVTCSSINNSGSYTGNGFPTIGANTVSGTSFPANTFVATNGNMARKTDASERRLKENIENFEFDTEAFIGVNPVTFNYKRDAVSTDEQAQALNVGFILDDFEEAGLSDFLVYQAEGDSFKQLRYDLLAIYLHKVVQTQNQTIKSLEARITALESQV